MYNYLGRQPWLWISINFISKTQPQLNEKNGTLSFPGSKTALTMGLPSHIWRRNLGNVVGKNWKPYHERHGADGNGSHETRWEVLKGQGSWF